MMNQKQEYHWYFRTFPHANSLRKQVARFDEDRKEILEYTDISIRLRNGRNKIPNMYNDIYPSRAFKWVAKPKTRRNRDNRKTIRKGREEKTMFLHLAFDDGSNPYVFFGTRDQVEEDLDLWKRFWKVDIIKTLKDGSMFCIASEK